MKRRYFAYGSNMSVAQMAERCPGARVRDEALLPDMRFIITARGYANAVAAAGEHIWGILWTITPADEASLDRYEGVRPGHYRKEVIDVVKTDGVLTRALIYLANEEHTGTPVPGYLEGIVAAARHHGLPADYVARLEGWSRPPA